MQNQWSNFGLTTSLWNYTWTNANYLYNFDIYRVKSQNAVIFFLFLEKKSYVTNYIIKINFKFYSDFI